MKTKDLYNQEVLRLENKCKHELTMVKEEIHKGYEYIQPVNLLKRTLSKASKSPEIKEDLMKISLNMATSFISSKVVGKSKSPIKKWIVEFLQSNISDFVSGNGGNIKLGLEKFALKMLKKISKKASHKSGPEGGIPSNLTEPVV
jgi:hypothetical protein